MDAKYAFISHSSKDNALLARMRAYLSEQKLFIWDDSNLQAGEWDEQLSIQMRNASAYVLIVSENSLRSGEVKKEIRIMQNEFDEHGKPIIPYVIDDAYFHMQGSMMDYQFGANSHQAVIVKNYGGEEEAFAKLAGYLKSVISVFENNRDDFVFAESPFKLDAYVGSDECVFVPDFVNEIGDSAFSGNTKLKKAVIPPSVKKIGKFAFLGCVALEKIEGMQGVEECFSNCFSNTPLQTRNMIEGIVFGGKVGTLDKKSVIIIEDGARVIAANAFYGVPSETVVLPEGLEIIGARAFGANTDLNELTIPASVKVIGKGAFKDCLDLDRVVFKGIVPPSASAAFDKETILEGNK